MVKRMTALLLTMLLLTGAALADRGVIMTPGGDVKLRRKPCEKSGVLAYVPNGTGVEVLSADEDWAQVVYGKHTGYIGGDYIRVVSRMAGMTVYPETDTMLLHTEPDNAAPVCGAAGAFTPVTVLSTGDDFCRVTIGSADGYAETDLLLHQWETPGATPIWIPRAGYVTDEQTLTGGMDGSGDKLRTLLPGEPVTVTVVGDGICLVQASDDWGWTSVSGIRLLFPETAVRIEDDSASVAENALKKAFKPLEKLDYVLIGYPAEDVAPDGYRLVSCVDFGGRPLYTALLDDHSNVVVMTDDTAFSSKPVKAVETPAEPGDLTVRLNSDTIGMGEVLQISVQAWPGAECTYTIYKDGGIFCQGTGSHRTAAFRPREAGEYAVRVEAADPDGNRAQQLHSFTVSGERGETDPVETIYSQKDGWWADRAYDNSNLQQSGCAIFTLSHALARMGHGKPEEIAPAALAQQYANCLTPDGTANVKLIRSAARRFSFTTQDELVKERSKIARMLRQGTMFTFSVARGHIALADGISEDGRMVHIVDSAPSATFTRIPKRYALYYEGPLGGFFAAETLDDIPGARWFIETDEYGGLEYWLELNYVTARGVRIMKPKDAK